MLVTFPKFFQYLVFGVKNRSWPGLSPLKWHCHVIPKIKTCKLCKKDTDTTIRNVSVGLEKLGKNSPGRNSPGKFSEGKFIKGNSPGGIFQIPSNTLHG